VPVCEENGLLAKNAVIFTQAEGKTMIEDNVPAKLKHLSTQVAMAAQSSMHGLAFCGQQSVISSIMDMSAASGDLALTPALPAAGSVATDKAIRTARIVRPRPMDQVK
jgi:recombinational DNA repair protein RecT